MRQLLITDLDNTLYNWVDFFAPSFRGMIHALAREMALPEEKLIEGFREVFKKRESLEYAFSIQELPFIVDYSAEDIGNFIELGKKVFQIVRRKNLKTYHGVKETLEFLTNNGVIIVAVTNAPRYYGELRLNELRIDKYFLGIAGWEGHQIPDDSFSAIINKKAEQGKFLSKNIKYRWDFTREEIKPNPFAYLEVINTLNISHRNTFVIGDSISKDLAPAEEIGANTIWAKYGKLFSEKNFNTLLDITHWDQKKIEKTYNEKEVEPDHVVETFSGLKLILQGNQLNLFNDQL